MLRIASDLVPALVGAAKGDLADVELAHDPRAAVTVMAVSGGYPGSYPKGKLIEGLDSIDTDATVAFHAGTTRNAEGNLVTSGGRVIAFSSLGDSVEEALSRSFKAIETVDFDGKYYRRDIGSDLLRLAATIS